MSLTEQNRIGNKRHLPVKPKEKVFNEWGALLRHQDEIQDELEREDMRRRSTRMLMYKNELDQ